MKNKTTNAFIATITILAMIFSSFWFASAVPPNPVLLDPETIPKYVNQLVAAIPVYEPTNVTDGSGNTVQQDYTINMTYFREQILPLGTPLVGSADNMTTVWDTKAKFDFWMEQYCLLSPIHHQQLSQQMWECQ